MNELIARAAKAVETARWITGDGKTSAENIVCTVLAAIYEPTEDMQFEGCKMLGGEAVFMDATRCWHAMIDEALK